METGHTRFLSTRQPCSLLTVKAQTHCASTTGVASAGPAILYNVPTSRWELDDGKIQVERRRSSWIYSALEHHETSWIATWRNYLWLKTRYIDADYWVDRLSS